MLVLGIYGSPRPRGNTDLMLDAFMEGAENAGAATERLYVRHLDIRGCLGCGGCDETGQCVQFDDMRKKVYPLLGESPRIVVASPIYFYSVTGQLKLLVDRSQAFFMWRKVLQREGRDIGSGGPPRKGFFLAAGATRGKRLFECPSLTMKYFFDAVNAAPSGELCYRELDEKGAVLKHPVALAECREAGRKFAGE